MTNILAIILATGGLINVNPSSNLLMGTHTSQLKTNVTERRYPPQPETTYFVNGTTLYADEKWQTTVVTKEEKLTFDWMGKPREVVESSVVSSNVVHLKVKQDWEVVPDLNYTLRLPVAPTNAPIDRLYYFTNSAR